MAQSAIPQDTTQITNNSNVGYTTTATELKYRTINNGSPITHNDVDANFEIIRKAINGVISDIDGVVDKDLTSDLSGAQLGFTEGTRNYPIELGKNGTESINTRLYVNVPWTDTTYTASGTGLSLSGTTFSHADTSTQASSNNSGRTYIQDITLDGFGHVTGLSTATETVVNTDTNTTYSAGTGLTLSGTIFSNSAPDKTVTLTAGSNVTIGGTYPNFSISSTDTNTTYSNATTSASGLMSSTDKTKLNGIATSANNYSHPTGDGNLHVPATGTTNNGNVLTAGSTAGSFSWQAPGGSSTHSSATLFSGTNLQNSGRWAVGNLLYGWKGFNNITIFNGIGGGTTYPSMESSLSNVIKHVSGNQTVISGQLSFELNLNPNSNDPTIWYTRADSTGTTRDNITMILQVAGNATNPIPDDLIPKGNQYGTGNCYAVGRFTSGLSSSTSAIYEDNHQPGSVSVSSFSRTSAQSSMHNGTDQRIYIFLDFPNDFGNTYFKQVIFSVAFFNSVS
jgi:hypothetical protein